MSGGALLDAPSLKGYEGEVIHVSLAMPTELEDWVDTRVSRDGFADTGDYLRELNERDQATHEARIAHVRGLIEEGLASGVLDADVDEIFDELIAEDPDLRA